MSKDTELEFKWRRECYYSLVSPGFETNINHSRLFFPLEVSYLHSIFFLKKKLLGLPCLPQSSIVYDLQVERTF